MKTIIINEKNKNMDIFYIQRRWVRLIRKAVLFERRETAKNLSSALESDHCQY